MPDQSTRDSPAGGADQAGGRALYWRLQITGWSLYGVFNAIVALWVAHFPLIQAVGQGVALGSLGLGFSHLLERWIRHRGLATRPLAARVGYTIVLGAAIGVPAGTLIALAGLEPWQTADMQAGNAAYAIAIPAVHALNWTCMLLVWRVVYLAILSFRERARAQLRESEMARALQLAQLRLLEAQLNPHFLFNALNTVRALIAENPTRAQQAVTQLARTLRYALNSGQEELVTLERELAIVDDYLAIEALRLEDRLNLVREISPATRSVRIPVMLLQMLVENAIKHGIAELPQGGELKLRSEIDSGMLILTVENTRPRSSSAGLVPDSVGLRNSTQRLDLLFGPRASLDLDITQPDRAIARVRIPCDP